MPYGRDALLVLAAFVSTLLLFNREMLYRPHTTAWRAKVRGEKAFVLSVQLKFTDEHAAEEFLTAWSKLADYCYSQERFLYQYEISRCGG